MPDTSLPLQAAAPRAPRFRQIIEHLKRSIVAGSLPAHAALPSERAVAEQHGVSRMTARRALEAMEAEGLAYSEGRKGRFVSPQRLSYPISSMANFVTDAEAAGIDLEIEVIAHKQTRAGDQLAHLLKVPVGEALDEKTRLFRNQGHATFLETEFIPERRRAALLSRSGAVLANGPEQRYSPLGHDADIVVRMRALQEHEAALLGLAPYQAGIELEQLVHDEHGKPYCFSLQIWRGELAQFSAKAIVSREAAS